MNKIELTVLIDALLGMAIEAHEITDLHLEETDNGTLHNIDFCLTEVVNYLRKARRAGRVLLEEYEDDLTKKPEYIDLDDSIEDKDEDEE